MNEADEAEYVDLDLERQVLKYIALKDPSISLRLSPSMFFGTAERKIFEILKRKQAAFPKKTLPNVVLKEVSSNEVDVVDQTLDEVFAAATLSNYRACETIVDHLHDLSMQRIVISRATEAISLAQQDNVEGALKALQNASRESTEQRIESGDYLEDFEEREAIIKERAKEEKNKKSTIIPTGIKQFDDIAGGIMKGEVGVMVAQTGGGKSVSKLNFAIIAWLLGYNVGYFGLEMKKNENQFRMDSFLTEIPSTFFRLAKLSDKEMKAWRKRVTDFRKQKKNYIEFVSGKGLTMTDILATAEGIESRRGSMDMMILDHIVLVKSQNERQDFHMQQKDTFESLLEWTDKRNKATWTSSQSTDEGVKRKEGMRVVDVKYARWIAESAHIIMAMYQSEMDEASGEMNLKVIKGRGIKKMDKIVLKPRFDNMVLDSINMINFMLRLEKNKRPRKTKSTGTVGRRR